MKNVPLTGNLTHDVDNILLNHLHRYPNLLALLTILKDKGLSKAAILQRMTEWGAEPTSLTYLACEAQLVRWHVQ